MNLGSYLVQNEAWSKDLLSQYERFAQHSTRPIRPADCLLFVTVLFDQKRMSAYRREKSISDCAPELKGGRLLYRHAVKLVDVLTGSSTRRQRPLVLVGVDYEGSKWASAQPATSHNIHLHGVWVVPPEEKAAYQTVLASVRLRMRLNRYMIQSVYATPYDSTKSLADAAGYALKGFAKAQFDATPWTSIDRYWGTSMPPVDAVIYPEKSHKRMRTMAAGTTAGLEPWEC